MKTTDKELQKEINEIISAAGTPEEALEKICNTYPEVDREVLVKNFEEEKEKAEKAFAEKADSEAIQNLSEDELESVAGGSFGSWMKKNWPYVVGTAAIATVGAVCLIRGYRSKANAQSLAAAEKKGYNDGVNQTLTTKKMQHEDIGLNASNFVNN